MAQQNKSDRTDPCFQPLLEHWASCVQLANETTQRMLNGGADSGSPLWRRQWFDALRQQSDIYMRTPLFLQSMKDHIDALVRAKQRSDHTPESLASLENRLAEFEQAVRQQMESLEGRLESLEKHLPAPVATASWQHFLEAFQLPQTCSEPAQGATAHEVVYQEGTLKLLRYANSSVNFAEPIVICFALVNRPYIMDLQEDRSVVRHLLRRGFDVYLIDWGVPTDADHTLTLSDYVCRLMRNVADFVSQQTGSPQLNLLGYCMGGTMSAMFTALHRERVRNLTLLAAPIDFGGDDGLLSLWAREEYFDVDQLIDAYGNCPGEFLRYCFQLMKPVQNFAEKYVTFCENVDDSDFLGNFLAMERWVNDSVPVAGETFREYVKMLYQQNRLVQGKLSLSGTTVRLEAIDCPLLLLVAEQDHLVPPSSTLAIGQHVRSSEVKTMSIKAGHIGLAVSSRAHRELWPEAADWIARHSKVKQGR